MAVPVTDIMAQVTAIERLDDRRDELIAALRQEASARARAARPTTSIRESVLDALAELGWPQNAGFLEEFLWTTRHLHVESRAFAPLRRDEHRAWERGNGIRPAYIAPALNPDGTPNPRWITSSAWDLERRVVASGTTERMLDLQKILALGAHADEEDDARQRRPVDTLIERYASQLLEATPPPTTATARESAKWRAEVLGMARSQVAALREDDDQHRKTAAAALAGLPESARVWGASA